VKRPKGIPQNSEAQRSVAADIKNSVTAGELAFQLFPPPDPINFARREAVSRLNSSDWALHNALELRETANGIVFTDLSRLWIHPTRAEILLALELADLRTASRYLADALDQLAGARRENGLRFYDERARERLERGTSR
jgi:hypothetical protein